MNPREANNVPLTKDVLPVVETFCRRETCVAVGEIGFDRQTNEEESAIRAQLKLAKKYDMPVLVHLPLWIDAMMVVDIEIPSSRKFFRRESSVAQRSGPFAFTFPENAPWSRPLRPMDTENSK